MPMDKINPHWGQLENTTPGPGADLSDQGGTVRRSKAIPNSPTAHLQRAQFAAHMEIHTPEGIHAFDGPRRNLVERGVKLKLINHELGLRGEPGCCDT